MNQASKGRLKEDEARKYFQQLIKCTSPASTGRCVATPNFVAPEVINNKGYETYDGAKANLWSCGVILYVLRDDYLPFEDSNLVELYKKIFKADFACPPWFSSSAMKFIKRILDPNSQTIASLMDELRRNVMLSISMPRSPTTQASHSTNSNDENVEDD
nr:hypothetical protein PRUPE_4G085000 [Ipomoea trifida]